MSSVLLNPRKPLFWLAGVAVAAAFFASGALVARATIDDDSDDSPAGQAQVVLPGISAGEGSRPANIPASYGDDDVKSLDARGMPGASWAGCRAPLPAGLISGATIDWSKANFAPAFPTTGFSALNFSISSNGDCNKDGTATNGQLAVTTAWVHDATGLDAYVTQTASPEKVASVLREDSATFWANGYRFDVGVNGYHMLPVAEDAGPARPAPDIAPASPGGAASSGALPPGGPNRDPRAAEVLRILVSQLSPSTDLKCFWTMGQGDWSSLTALGVGDPRTAIPGGFTLSDMNVTAFKEPAAGCDTSVKPAEGFSFNANWQGNNGRSYLGVSVYNSGQPGDYPGQINEYGANWTRNGLQFGVYAKAEDPIGLDTIRAIAKALDPSFSEACFIQERKLTDGDLPALGFSPAKAPSGYKLVRSHMTASEIADGCPKPDGFEPSYSLNWSFENGADVIDAGAHRYGGNQPGDGSGYQAPNHLNWVSANGTNYYVNAYSKGINPQVSKDDLIAVAKSIDPAFDISKLKEGPGDVKPLPAERSAR